MLVDYLLIGHEQDGEIKKVEHEPGDMLYSSLTFSPANDDSIQYPERVFVVRVIHHLENRYAVCIARDVTALEINNFIESSRQNPIPEEVAGEI